MSSDRSLLSRRLGLLLALAILLPACGKKGDPLPAPRTIPRTIDDLTVRQRGFEVVLEMSYPKTTVAGLPYSGLDEVVLFSMERPVPSLPVTAAPSAPSAPSEPSEPSAPSAPAPLAVPAAPDPREFAGAAQPLVRISGAELASAISGDRITLRFRLPEPIPQPAPLRYFAVRAHAAGGETSDFSNRVSLRALDPLDAPLEFALAGRKDGVVLTWQAPAGTAGASGGSSAIAYRVYRRSAALTGYGEPIAKLNDPGARTALDSSAVYGQRYVYAVAAVAAQAPLVEGALSAEREILFEDRFAPAIPGGLTALPGEGSVRLVWAAVAEPDVAGYLVERADPGSDFHRITEASTADLEITDRGLGSGFTFRYRVAAVDRSGNLGEFSSPVAARVP